MDKQNDRVVRVRPASALAGYIKDYVFSRLALSEGGDVFLPFSGALLSLLKRTPLTAGPPPFRQRLSYKEPMVLGPLASPVVFGETGERLDDITVVFTALGASCLLRIPMHRLSGNAVEAGRLLPRRNLLLLAERLAEADTVEEARNHLDRFFLSRVAGLCLRREPIREIAPQLAAALHHIESLPDWKMRSPTRVLAETVAVSERSLRRVFREEIGLSPKQYLAMVRIRRIARTLAKAEPHDLSAVALDYGYVDYAHFANDFHHRTLTWPTQYIRSPRHRYNDRFL
jgi:hypothetical protein